MTGRGATVDFSLTQPALELSSLTRSVLASCTDDQAWPAMAAAGILAAAVPERAGGDGYGLLEQLAVLIELGRAASAAPYLESIVLGTGAIAAFGTDAQVRRWAAPAACGELIITAALEEPHAAGAFAAVPSGASAGLVLVPSGDDAFCVLPDDPGVKVRPQELVDGPGAAELALADVRLGDDRKLPGAARWLADRATVGLCALQLGVAERALKLTAEYAKTRQQFGRPIGAFQAVAQRLADAYVDVAAIRLTMWQAAFRLDAGLPCAAEIATAKFWAADGGHRVAHTAVHVHGGAGIDVSQPVHRYFTAAKRNEFALGGATAQLRRLGAHLAGIATSSAD
jgi:3-oxocholest-4-en-26-oyl-CoA dehydrogenase beta subunit